MALRDKKITDAEINTRNVKSVQGSRLRGTVQENKNVFDKLVEFVCGRLNEVIEEITNGDGASDIKATVPGTTKKSDVQSVLNRLNSITRECVDDVAVSTNMGYIGYSKYGGTYKMLQIFKYASTISTTSPAADKLVTEKAVADYFDAKMVELDDMLSGGAW